MAAFLTHLVVGERVWAQLDGCRPQTRASLRCTPAGERVERSAKSSSDGWWSNEEDYGSFLFGCLAPDVDKLCAGLEQGVAQFLPKDEGGIYSYQRICALLNGDY